MGSDNGASKEVAKSEPITHVDIAESAKPAGGASAKPTLSELADAGLTTGEIEMAKKQGIVEGEPASKESDKKEPKKEGEPNGEKEKAKEEKSVDERFRVLSKGKSPEQILAEVSEKGALTPDQESILVASLSQNGKSLYWSQKKERQRRQKAEADNVTAQAEKQKEIDDLKAQLAKSRQKTVVDELGLDEVVEETDPKKKPLTVEELEKIDAEKAKKADEANKLRSERSSVLKEALDYQQEDAKARYEDFEQVLGGTKAILDAANAGELEKLFPDVRKRSRVKKMIVDSLRGFANADAFEEGDFNAADMAYELGKEHPEFGKQPKNNVTKNDETGADGDPEKAARAITNASRRGSSATLSGSGSRRVALDELTPDQAAKLPTMKFNKLPKETRERLLRGK